MNCVVIDDEPLAIGLMEQYIKKTTGLKLLRSFENAFEALYYVQTHAVDILFLDIQMPGINGLQFIAILKFPPKIIITSAHKDYALQALQSAVVDYLLKPIPYERFLEAVSKAIESPSLKQSAVDIGLASTLDKFYIFKEKGVYTKIFVEDIYYLHGDRNYCSVYFKDGQLNVRGNLSFYGNKLAEDRFLRVHKSYFVSIRHIDRYDSDSLWIHGVSIPLGRRYRKKVYEYLEQYNL